MMSMLALLPFLLLAAVLEAKCAPEDRQAERGAQAPKAGT
jgi:hypothetical protein